MTEATRKRGGNRRPDRLPPNAGEVADRIEDLAARVNRLTVSRRDPERFHVERSEIAGQLRELAREARGQ